MLFATSDFPDQSFSSLHTAGLLNGLRRVLSDTAHIDKSNFFPERACVYIYINITSAAYDLDL